MKNAVTLKDVARKAGVHYSTASRALDPNKRSLVSRATAAHVRAVAGRLGYQGHMVARSLRRGRTNTIGIVIPDLSNPFWAPVLHGIHRACGEHGYVVLIGETYDERLAHRELLETLASWGVDAIISGAARLNNARMLRRFVNMRVPVLLMVRSTPGGFPFVVDDGALGAQLAFKHLVDLGHRVVAQLPGPQDIYSFAIRRRGFLDHARSPKVTVVDIQDAGAAPSYQEGKRLMAALLKLRGPRPTGIFAHNDLMAIGAIDALREANLDCPRDVSVVGYNDSPLVDHISPSLSTLRVPMDQLGYLAGKKAIEMLDNPDQTPESVQLVPKLIARGSTGPPRQ
jgi:LacI family transcriptional regulator